jgi:nucleotide-binding universal stress UspA family protein
MFRHLLVPLDGSRLSEAALPPTAILAQRLGAQVTLMHVIERNAPEEIHGEHHLQAELEACDYLAEQADKAFPPEIKVNRHVHTEEVTNVARSIVEHTGELSPDLIVMCTHGKAGMREWMTGSIAQQIIGHGRIPVLLIRPQDSGETPTTHFARILVALDGKPEHESGLPIAFDLATQLQSALRLVLVVPTLETLTGKQAASGKLLPGTTTRLLEINEEGGRNYLLKHAQRGSDLNLETSIEVRRGDPAQQIVQAANAFNADLIVLTTHGKAGMGAFWAGSTAPRIVGYTHIPLLLIPAEAPQA